MPAGGPCAKFQLLNYILEFALQLSKHSAERTYHPAHSMRPTHFTPIYAYSAHRGGPLGLRRGSVATRWPELRVRIPLRTWTSVYC